MAKEQNFFIGIFEGPETIEIARVFYRDDIDKPHEYKHMGQVFGRKKELPSNLSLKGSEKNLVNHIGETGVKVIRFPFSLTLQPCIKDLNIGIYEKMRSAESEVKALKLNNADQKQLLIDARGKSMFKRKQIAEGEHHKKMRDFYQPPYRKDED